MMNYNDDDVSLLTDSELFAIDSTIDSEQDGDYIVSLDELVAREHADEVAIHKAAKDNLYDYYEDEFL